MNCNGNDEFYIQLQITNIWQMLIFIQFLKLFWHTCFIILLASTASSLRRQNLRRSSNDKFLREQKKTHLQQISHTSLDQTNCRTLTRQEWYPPNSANPLTKQFIYTKLYTALSHDKLEYLRQFTSIWSLSVTGRDLQDCVQS